MEGARYAHLWGYVVGSGHWTVILDMLRKLYRVTSLILESLIMDE